MLLRTHLIEVLCVHTAHLACHIHAHERHRGACALIGRGRLHRCCLRADQMCSRSRRIHKCRVALHFFQHLLVFFARLHAGYAERYDFKAAQVAPLARQHFIQRVRQLHRMSGERRIADTHVGNLRKRGLKRGKQLGLELSVQPVAGIILTHIAADVRVEQNRVADAVAVLAEAANGNVDVNACPLVNNTEGNRRWRAVLVADELLGVKIVHALILGRLAAEGEALSDVLERVEDTGSQLTGEDRRLGRSIIDKLARLGAELRHLALIDDDHTLSVGDCHDGAVGDDVLAALVVAAAPGNAVQALDRHHVLRNGFTVKILLPLIGHHTASRTQCCFNESHFLISLSLFTMPTDLPPQEYGCR